MSFKIVIPARYASTRLPGKPLADIAGKPMVVRVAEQAAKSNASEVLVATDHEGVCAAVERHGFRAVITRSDHASGTDRIAEVAMLLGWSQDVVVVNVQGDEPLIEPDLINHVAGELALDAKAAIATACHPIESIDDFLNPSVVKVVTDARGLANYFSRAPIPWPRDAFTVCKNQLPKGSGAKRHIGIYAYRVGFLLQFGALEPSPYEALESLEQLRALWHGFRVRVLAVNFAPEPGVDTVEDLKRIRCKFDVRQD